MSVSTPAGGQDLCPVCGVQRPINDRGRFRQHPAVHPDEGGIGPDGDCWATGRTRAEVELNEALRVGTAWENLETGR